MMHVRVAEHDHRVLAAKLEHRALQLSRARLPDRPPDLHRAGEEHLRDAGLHERGPGPRPVHDAHETLWHAGPFEHAADPLADQRRQRSGLQDHAVAGHQCHRDLAEGDRPRIVPGRDDPDHAERLVGERRALALQEPLRHGDPLVGQDLRPGARNPLQRIDRRQQLHRERLVARLALLGDEQVADLVALFEQHLRCALQVAPPLFERQMRPRRLQFCNCRDDVLHLPGRRNRHGAERGAGSGVERLELLGDRGGGGLHRPEGTGSRPPIPPTRTTHPAHSPLPPVPLTPPTRPSHPYRSPPPTRPSHPYHSPLPAGLAHLFELVAQRRLGFVGLVEAPADRGVGHQLLRG